MDEELNVPDIDTNPENRLLDTGNEVLFRQELLTFDELPEWAQDNSFITKYYRPILGSWRYSAASIFQIHNETFNIWSHLAPAAACLGMIIYLLTRKSREFGGGLMEKSMLILLMAAAMTMLTCSWFFHAFNVHSHKTFCWTSKLDYLGITFMIAGSFAPWVYYVFYHQPKLRYIYLGMICTLGCACIGLSVWPRFAVPEYRWLRAVVFVVFGCSAIIPVIHAGFVHGIHKLFFGFHLWATILMGAIYISGAAIYSRRFPERYYPGKFDLAFSSHNIQHLCIVVASTFHCYGVFMMHLDRTEKGLMGQVNKSWA